jgi:hypothetical protein
MPGKNFLFGLLVFMTLPAIAQNYVSVYDNCNYGGAFYMLPPGNYRVYEMKIANDRLSSFQVPPGMKITIYEHDNFSGRSQTYTSSMYCLGTDWNDMTSSIVVEGAAPNYNSNDFVTFYNDCYSRGYSRSLGPGTYTGNDLGILRENISSFSIFGNLRVRLYLNNDNASGYYVNIDESQYCLGSSYNDRIRSVVIEYRPGGYGGNYGGNTGNNYATVYADCNYRGNSLRLSPGYYQGDKLGLLRYNISSIEIPSNLRAKVYINNEYLSGNYYLLTETTNCLSATMNNRIGSLVIEESGYNNNNNNNYPPDTYERVIIYTDGSYRGQSATLMPGTYSTMAQAGFPDNALSSLSVPVGYRVVLYEYENFKGKSYTIIQSKPQFFFSGWNDKTSSIAVYRDR